MLQLIYQHHRVQQQDLLLLTLHQLERNLKVITQTKNTTPTTAKHVHNTTHLTTVRTKNNVDHLASATKQTRTHVCPLTAVRPNLKNLLSRLVFNHQKRA